MYPKVSCQNCFVNLFSVFLAQIHFTNEENLDQNILHPDILHFSVVCSLSTYGVQRPVVMSPTVNFKIPGRIAFCKSIMGNVILDFPLETCLLSFPPVDNPMQGF